jgi:acyl carrier protein
MEVLNKIFKEFGIEREIEKDIELSDLGFDSIRIMELIILIEEELDIVIDDDDLVGENFETVETVIKLLEKYI